MSEKLTTFDPAELLTSDEAIATFLAAAFESGDVGYIVHALGVVAPRTWHARDRQGNRSVARANLPLVQRTRQSMLKTTLAVMTALGIELTAKPSHAGQGR